MLRSALICLALLATACDEYESCTEDNAPLWYLDADGDGWSPTVDPIQACWGPSREWVSTVGEEVDCDDADESIHPGADEVCDDLDNDCDSEIDEGATTTFHSDQDGDGHGDPDSELEACELPTGAADNEDDCDDLDPSAFPGNDEVCDGVDNDCDGEIDDGVTTTYHTDADGDGWGDEATPVEACEPGEAIVESVGDCDDGDAATHPEAQELWNDHDDDCDDLLDDVEILTVASGLLQGDVEHQEAGSALVLGGDFLDGSLDSIGDDYVVLGSPDEPMPFWALDASTYGQEGSLGLAANFMVEFEDPVALESIRGPMIDLVEDEEGRDDWLMTASLYDYHFAILLEHGDLELDTAVVDFDYIGLFGDTTFNLGLDSWIIDIMFPPCGEECRQPKASAGGFMNTDEPEAGWVAIGLDRWDDDTMGSECGSLAFFQGPFTHYDQHDDDGYTTAYCKRLVGEGSYDHLGTDLLMADFDGEPSAEGYFSDDLLVGAGEYPGTGDELGAVYLVMAEDLLGADWTGYLGASVPYRVRVEGTVPGERIGALGNLVTPGDLDGDGLLDLVIPSPNTNRVYVLLAPALRNEDDLELSDTELYYDEDLYAFEAMGVGFGAAVAASSDLDGDGNDDLVVGGPDAPGADGASLSGAAWVFSWERSGWTSAEANGLDRAVMSLYGENPGDSFGAALASGGDMNEDGQDDLLIGAPGWDARFDEGYLTDEGRVYVLLGGGY
jgi:hypothetical protein